MLTYHPLSGIIKSQKGKGNPEHRKGKQMNYNEADIKIMMAGNLTKKEAERALADGSYVMELQDFIDAYRDIPEESRFAVLNGFYDEEAYLEEVEENERTISAIIETAEAAKTRGDEYFDIVDEFNTVVNFGGKQYVVHRML